MVSARNVCALVYSFAHNFCCARFYVLLVAHVPHDTEQEVNFTCASTVREGLEWLLNSVMQYQNYHLIHHLYPTTPFYNNYKVWREIEPELRKKQLRFSITWQSTR